MQQVEERGGEAAFIRNISSVTDEIHTYLATPAAPEKERLMRVLQELGDGIIARHPSMANAIANFVAHGQVLLDKQEPTEEIFQEATSDRISVLGEALIAGLEAEIAKVEAIVANYERGILAAGGALWLLWLAIALRLPKDNRQQDDGRPADRQHEDRAAMDKIAAAAAPPRLRPSREEDEMDRLTASLIQAEAQHTRQADAARAVGPAAQRVTLEVVSRQLTGLAERINSSADILTDLQVKLFSNGSDSAPDPAAAQPFRAADEKVGALAADEELKTASAVVASIRAQANGPGRVCRTPAVAVGKTRRRPRARQPQRLHRRRWWTTPRPRPKALVVKELSPVPDILASETEMYLILANIVENSVWAVEERGHKKGVIRIETGHTPDSGVAVTITDNGNGH